MIQDSRNPVFLPPPQIIRFLGRDSSLPCRSFSNLQPTRKQLSQLPEKIVLTSLQSANSPEAYQLEVTHKAVHLAASDEKGWHYGLLTLKQLAGGSTDYLPQCEIKDWPSFENRGIMLDVSRSNAGFAGRRFDDKQNNQSSNAKRNANVRNPPAIQALS